MLKAIIYGPDGVCGFYGINERNKDYYISADEALNKYKELNLRYNGRIWYCEDCNLDLLMKYSMTDFFKINKNGVVLGLTDLGEKFVSLGCDLILPAFINGIEVVELGESCFEFSEINSILLPNTLKKINKLAFCRSAISEIVIPDSCIEIGECAFMECYELCSIKIGRNVYKIDLGAFYDCRGLDEGDIYIPNSICEIGEDAFGCIENTAFTVDKKANSIRVIQSEEIDMTEFDDYDEDEDDYDEDDMCDEECFFGAYNVSVKYLR